MLIISVIVGVTIGVTKAKLDKITNYTYTNAYLTLRDVTRNIFSDFNPQDEDYILTNNSFITKIFSAVFPPAQAKTVYACAIDRPNTELVYVRPDLAGSRDFYESLDDVDCSSQNFRWFSGTVVAPGLFFTPPHTGSYVKCPGRHYYTGNKNDVRYRYWANDESSSYTFDLVKTGGTPSCNSPCGDGTSNCGEYYTPVIRHYTCLDYVIPEVVESGHIIKPTQYIEGKIMCSDMYSCSKATMICEYEYDDDDDDEETIPVEPDSCIEPSDAEKKVQYCQGKTFNSSPAVCSWEEIVPWPPACPETEEWNYSATDCRCIPTARTLPRRGANLCKMFAERTNTKSGTTDCSGSSISVNTTDFQDKKADLTLRNGMLVYNLSHDPSEIAVLSNNKQGGSYAGVPNTNSYGYTVYVDINGKSGDSKLWEDVYPFYITMSGFVIPGYDKTANPAGSGGDSVDHMQVSVESEIIDYNGVRKLNWVERSVPFQLGACRAGYVGSDTPYCNGVFRAASCSASNSSCRLKYISPVKFF